MNYQEAKEVVNNHLHLTGKYSTAKSFPFYIKWLLIVPRDSDFDNRAKVLQATVENDFDNYRGLVLTSFIHDDLDVFLVATDGRFDHMKQLTAYLSEIPNAS